MNFSADDRGLIERYRREGFHDADELLAFVEGFFGLHIPRVRVCPEHNAPAEYLTAAFFETAPDCVCWANRGGGKTLMGALVSWLDSVFKPGCGTKILGGSKEQSQRMYDHLTGDGDGYGIVQPEFQYLIEGEMLASKTRLVNGANIQIMTASMRSVRGPHPQKLKMDEVDEIDPRIYEAALSIPMTKGGIGASTHIFSTMHRPHGLMQSLVEEAPRHGYRLFKFCILDVLEKCVGRDCGTCDLWEDCQGRAVNADGFYSIEDAISKKRQVSEQTWKSEYLCLMPSQEGLIYPGFDPSHII